MPGEPKRNWRSVLTVPWLLSHAFAATLILGFIAAGLWQLDRLDQRRAENAVIEARAEAAAVTLDDALSRPADELAYVRIEDEGRFVDSELIRVANRSQNGLGGDWVIGLFEADSGQILLVNRGFAARTEAAGPAVDGPITGWLQDTQTKDGLLGATDTGEGERVPRLDVEAIGERFALDGLAPAWLQTDQPTPSGTPEPVPLPEIDERNHLSYAVQWFIFATLSIVIYGLLVRKRAGEQRDLEPVP